MNSKEALIQRWISKLQKGIDDNLTDDELGELKDEMTDELTQTECEIVYDELVR